MRATRNSGRSAWLQFTLRVRSLLRSLDSKRYRVLQACESPPVFVGDQRSSQRVNAIIKCDVCLFSLGEQHERLAGRARSFLGVVTVVPEQFGWRTGSKVLEVSVWTARNSFHFCGLTGLKLLLCMIPSQNKLEVRELAPLFSPFNCRTCIHLYTGTGLYLRHQLILRSKSINRSSGGRKRACSVLTSWTAHELLRLAQVPRIHPSSR